VGVTQNPPQEYGENPKNSSLASGGSRTRPASTYKNLHAIRKIKIDERGSQIKGGRRQLAGIKKLLWEAILVGALCKVRLEMNAPGQHGPMKNEQWGKPIGGSGKVDSGVD
jgi:hypothetical protein